MHVLSLIHIQLKVRVININKDVHILNKCKTLRDYMTFVNKVRFKMGVEGDDVRIAVTELKQKKAFFLI